MCAAFSLSIQLCVFNFGIIVYFLYSVDVFQESCERDLKAIKLRMRQDRLKSLLFEEAKQYEVKFHCSSFSI